jgi:hypothetical protein
VADITADAAAANPGGGKNPESAQTRPAGRAGHTTVAVQQNGPRKVCACAGAIAG